MTAQPPSQSSGPGPRRGAVACGHPVVRDAASTMLEAGGNAFDAVSAGLWAACVAEPLLASPGGGGFLLARPVRGPSLCFDFFAQTPLRRRPAGEVDFRKVVVDFGTTRQEFHIGLGAAATPGAVAGLFEIHRTLGRIPMREVAAPAVEAARRGVRVNRMQAYVATVLDPILRASEGAAATFVPGGRPLREGDIHLQPDLAGLIEALALEGPALFYRGEIAERVERACREGGGHLTREDFERYRVEARRPLSVDFGGWRVRTNPPPATGGVLVAFGLRILEGLPRVDAGDPVPAATRTALALAATRDVRMGEGMDGGIDPTWATRVLSPETVARYRTAVELHPPASRGTTHLSVLDDEGNAAALSVSNGEGCGWVIPGTGVMLNNVLGESDLLPRGFGRWPTDTRLTSMMAPTLAEQRGTGRTLVLGSGGSNRIRSAILQVLGAILDEGVSLEEAIARPRLHLEGTRLEIEGGFGEEVVTTLTRRWPDHTLWSEQNLFFGGVHAVEHAGGRFRGAGDPRRGGEAVVLGRE